MTTVETTHKATLELGPGVVNNTLIWSSASGITAADPLSYGGCERRWWFEHVGGHEQPSTEAMKKGTEVHADIEPYILTGRELTNRIALACKPFIPKPGPGLLVEHPIIQHDNGRITGAWLYARGKNGIHVPIAGHVDLWNFRGEFINEDAELVPEPHLNTLETKDWKTTKSFDFAKTPAELAVNIQLNTYAEAGFRMWPHLEYGRLTHVYSRTSGSPEAKLVTILRSRKEVEQRWEYAESVVRSIQDIARETDQSHIPGRRKACDAYKGCPHRDYCTEYHKTSTDSLFAKVAADIKGDVERETQMGLLTGIPMNPAVQPTAPAPAPVAPPQYAPPAAPQVDMRAQLAAEEAQLRAQQAQTQQQVSMQAFADAWQRIVRHNRGTPQIGGLAAQMYNTMNNYPPTGLHAGFSGTGQIGAISLQDPAHILQLAAELDAQGAPPAAQPAPQQVIYTQPIVNAVADLGPPAPAMSILAPGTPESQPQLAMPQPSPAPVVDTSEPAPKATRGRPKKDKTAAQEAAGAPQQTAPTTPSPSSVVEPPVASAAEVANRFVVYVNCVPNRPYMTLYAYIDRINTEIAKRHCVDDAGKPTLQDVRCAPPKSVLGYAAWKGVVHETVLAMPPAYGDAPLVLFTSGSELYDVVAQALLVHCERHGLEYVRGVS